MLLIEYSGGAMTDTIRAKCYQKAFLPMIPNFFCYVTIKDGNIVHVRYGNTVFEVPVKGSNVEVKPKGARGFIDAFDDVVIHHGGTNYKVDDLQTTTSLQSWVKKRN